MSVYIRADPGWAARNDPVYHNEQCPKLTQRNLKPGTYKRVEKPPPGHRACRNCGG